MTQRPWIAHYPDGVDAVLAEPPFANLPALLAAASTEYADTIAFTQCMPNGMNGSLTYSKVDELSSDFAAYLREVVGLSQGDRVAVQMPNCLAYPVVAFGILKAGCVLVNTNPLYTASEMVHQFSDSGAKALVIIDMFADRLPDVLAKTSIETVVTVHIAEFFPRSSPESSVPCRRSGADRSRRSRSTTRPSRARSPLAARSGTTRRRQATWQELALTRLPRSSTPAERPACRRAPCSRTAIWYPTPFR